jgi:hypothetical protein
MWFQLAKFWLAGAAVENLLLVPSAELYRCRGKDDARDVRRRIRGVHGKDKAARTRSLVTCRLTLAREPPLVRGTSLRPRLSNDRR